MNKVSKSLLVLFLTFLLGSCFGVFSIQAQDDNFVFEVIQECDIQYAGDSCVAELKLTNNTGETLDGTAILDIDYQGICGNSFEIGGIDIWYDGQISKMEWNGDRFVFIGFSIVKGETQPEIEIETVPNLCPGEYTFSLGLKGTTGEEEYITPPVVIGVSGGTNIPASAPSPLSEDAQAVDANNDDKIDILDFNILMINWGSTAAGNIADFNSDGKVDIFDFNLLMIHWVNL